MTQSQSYDKVKEEEEEDGIKWVVYLGLSKGAESIQGTPHRARFLDTPVIYVPLCLLLVLVYTRP